MDTAAQQVIDGPAKIKPRVTTTQRRWALGLLCILAVAAALRIAWLSGQGVWMDEARSVYIAESYPLTTIATQSVLKDYHQAWLVLLWGWVRLAGDSELAIRIPAIVFSLLGMWGVYRLGTRLFDPRVAWVTIALVSWHAFSLEYSQEARTYSLTLALSVWGVYLFTHVLWDEQVSRGQWLALALILALLPYSHMYTLLLIAALNVVFILLRRHGRSRWLPWLLIQLPALLVTLRFIPAMLAEQSQVQQALGWRFWVTSDPVENTLAWLLTFGGGLPADILNRDVLALILDTAAALAVIGLIGVALSRALHARPETRARVAVVASAAFLPPLFAIAISWLITPLFSVYLVRYVLYSVPFWWMLVAVGLTHALSQPLGRRIWGGLALALIVMTGMLANWNLLFGYTTRMPRSGDLRGLVADLRLRSQPGDLIVHTSYFSYFPVWYYLRDDRPQLALFGTQWERWLPEHQSALTTALPGIVRDQGYGRVWVIAFYDWETAPRLGDEWRIDLVVRRTVPSSFQLLDRRHFNDVDLYLYRATGEDRR